MHDNPDKIMPPMLWFLRFLLLLGLFVLFIQLIRGYIDVLVGVISIILTIVLVYGITIEKKWALYLGLSIFFIGFLSSILIYDYSESLFYTLFFLILLRERKYFK